MKDVFFSVTLTSHVYERSNNYYTDPQSGSVYHFISYIEEGSCRFVTEQNIVEAKAGDYLYVPKGLVYHSHWHSANQVRFKTFSFRYLPESDSRQYLLQKINCSEAIQTLIHEFSMNPEPNSYCIGLFFSTIAALLPSLEYQVPNKRALIIEKAKQYIIQNETCSVSDIAKHCLISESALYDTFKKEIGSTPNELRQQLLCEEATVLLSTTNRSVQDISNSLHFSSTSYFRKVLRKHTGKTPRQIRQSMKTI